MKIKLISTLSVLCFLIFSFNTAGQTKNEIPIELKDYISNISTSCEYKKVYPQTFEELLNGNYKPCPDSISQKEALEDIEQFEYLLETAYSGKEYWKKQGCDFSQIYSKAKEFAKSKEVFSVLEFENYISSLINGKIIDAHFSLRGQEYHTFSKRKLIYFTDILLEKNKKGKYIVIDSKIETVTKGDEFDDKAKLLHLFKTLSSANKEQYLVGVWSYEKVTEKNLSFNGKIRNIPFQESRLTKTKFNREPIFQVDTINKIPIISVATFDMVDQNIPYLTNFEKYGKNLQNEDKFILNLFNNTGGSSLYPMNFIKNLNTVVNSNGIEAYLCSPSLSQLFIGLNFEAYPDILKQPGMDEFLKEVKIHKDLHDKYKVNPKREWKIDIDKDSIQSPGTYNGKMVVLMNREVSSSSETAIKFSKSVKNAIFVGENTYGVGTFSNVVKFYLPNSNICIHLSYHISLMPDFQETIGFIPDYWLDTDQPIEEIVKWLNNPDTYQFKFK